MVRLNTLRLGLPTTTLITNGFLARPFALLEVTAPRRDRGKPAKAAPQAPTRNKHLWTKGSNINTRKHHQITVPSIYEQEVLPKEEEEEQAADSPESTLSSLVFCPLHFWRFDILNSKSIWDVCVFDIWLKKIVKRLDMSLPLVCL